MKYPKSTKRSLLMSALAMLLCVSMLIGSTFAWFTDSVTSAGNIIKSGTLDISMKWAKGTEDPATANWQDASTTKIFNYDQWEPGYTEARHIAVKNEGTLALKYQLTIVPTGEVTNLADVIDVYYIKNATQLDERADMSAYTPVGTLAELIDNKIAAVDVMPNGRLAAGEGFAATLVLKMQESATNEYQNKSIGTDFAVKLIATQDTVETDSFDNLYDDDADRDSNIKVMTEAELQKAFDDARDGDVITLANKIDVVNGLVYNTDAAVTLDLGGYGLDGSIATLLKLNSGNITIQNGYIKNVKDPATTTLVSVAMSGDAVAEIKNLSIETTGIGLLLQGNAKVTELNANINSYVNANGTCDASAICLNDGNARIDLISGGEYISTYTDDFINAYTGSFSGMAIYPVSLNSANVSIGEISGGTFLGRADDGINGATIFVNAGKIEKISGGYFGYCKYTMRNYPYFMITVNTPNGAAIDAITGGTFEYASGFGCEFENIVDQSGSKIEKRSETATVSVKFSSSVKTKVVEIWDVVAK